MTRQHRFIIIGGTIVLEFIIGIVKATVLPGFPLEIAYTIGSVATGYGIVKGVENVKKNNKEYTD